MEQRGNLNNIIIYGSKVKEYSQPLAASAEKNNHSKHPGSGAGAEKLKTFVRTVKISCSAGSDLL